jgi:hypothetical protein
MVCFQHFFAMGSSGRLEHAQCCSSFARLTFLLSSSPGRKALALREINLSHQLLRLGFISGVTIVSFAFPLRSFGIIFTNSSQSSNRHLGTGKAVAGRNFDRSIWRLPRANGTLSITAHRPCYYNCPDKQYPTVPHASPTSRRPSIHYIQRRYRLLPITYHTRLR